MMATVPHVTSGLGLRKFQADGFLLTRVYILDATCQRADISQNIRAESVLLKRDILGIFSVLYRLRNINFWKFIFRLMRKNHAI